MKKKRDKNEYIHTYIYLFLGCPLEIKRPSTHCFNREHQWDVPFHQRTTGWSTGWCPLAIPWISMAQRISAPSRCSQNTVTQGTCFRPQKDMSPIEPWIDVKLLGIKIFSMLSSRGDVSTMAVDELNPSSAWSISWHGIWILNNLSKPSRNMVIRIKKFINKYHVTIRIQVWEFMMGTSF